MAVSASSQPDPDAILADEMKRFEFDPLGYVLFVFDWGHGDLEGETGPDDWQAETLRDIGEAMRVSETAVRIAIASGHGIGKTALTAWVIHWFVATRPGCAGVVTANTADQLKNKTWRELSKWNARAINGHWFEWTATSFKAVERPDTWFIAAQPWSKERSEAFAGLHNQGNRVVLLFDEASAIDDKIWEVSEGALTDEDTEILWVAFGNPTRNTGRFRECFGKRRHRWVNEQIDSRTVEGTNKRQLEKWVEDYGEDSDFVRIRVRGMFPSMSTLQFISTEDADKALGKHLRPDEYEFAPKILTLDNAWEGDDEGVIGLRQGLAFKILRTFAKNDNDLQVATMLADCEDREKADAVFIDAGYGTGVVSCGKSWNRNWRLVWFSEKSTDPGCLNKRAEMWKKMRDWLKDGGAIPNDNVLYSDIISIETVGRSDGIIQLQSKKEMKAEGLPSPGRGDALALSFAYPVQQKAKRRGVQHMEQAEAWNPHDY